MERVVLFKGLFQYQVVNVFIDELAVAFRAMGWEAVVLDASAEGFMHRFADTFGQPVRFAAGFNGVGSGGEFSRFYQLAGIPYVGMLVDHPAYHWGRVNGTPEALWTCVDQTHVEFIAAHSGGRIDSAFLPHGATLSAAPSGGRDIELLFLGSGSDPEQQLAGVQECFGERVAQLVEWLVENAEAHRRLPLEAVMRECLATLRDGEETITRKVTALLPLVSDLIRARRRRDCLALLDRAGIPVTIHGRGWESLDSRSHRILPPVDYPEAVALMRRARVVLNVFPAFADGSHERLLSAMANGAVAVSDVNRFMEREFEEGRDYLGFHFDQLDRLPQLLCRLREEPGRIEAMAAAGEGKAVAGHLWRHRARQLVEIVSPRLTPAG